MSKLKPCPFCGTKSAVLNEYTAMSGHSYYYIECRNKKCNINPVTHNFGTEEEAIKAWDTRYERTCRVVSHSVFCGSFGCEEAGETWGLSCGHEVMTESGCDHPEYCIECGTKVVTQ